MVYFRPLVASRSPTIAVGAAMMKRLVSFVMQYAISGHIAPVCKSGTKKTGETTDPPVNRPRGLKSKGSKSGGAKWLGEQSTPDNDHGTFTLSGATPQLPFLVDMEVCMWHTGQVRSGLRVFSEASYCITTSKRLTWISRLTQDSL